MKNITPLLDKLYQPYKALLFYRSEAENDTYVESYDMDDWGKPINAHPLSLKESEKLAVALTSKTEKTATFLASESLISENVLYVNRSAEALVIWYTKASKRHLHFKKNLGIDSGEAALPPLLWKASKSSLSLWALAKEDRPDLNSPLYFAPFFNGHQDGGVCMGNVDIHIPEGCSLEKFMAEWERCYFGSSFSHLLGDVSPVKENIVGLWKKLIGTGKAFPCQVLKKTKLKLKDILP